MNAACTVCTQFELHIHMLKLGILCCWLNRSRAVRWDILSGLLYIALVDVFLDMPVASEWFCVLLWTYVSDMNARCTVHMLYKYLWKAFCYYYCVVFQERESSENKAPQGLGRFNHSTANVLCTLVITKIYLQASNPERPAHDNLVRMGKSTVIGHEVIKPLRTELLT